MTRMRSGVRLPLRPPGLSRDFLSEKARERLRKVAWVPFWVPFSGTDVLGRSRTAADNNLNRKVACARRFPVRAFNLGPASGALAVRGIGEVACA